MSRLIEDYALIGDCHTAALVSKEGSIDWLCLPQFDSPACFAALLGTPENGHWSICPTEPIRKLRRQYRKNTLILDTEFETDSGAVILTDCMVLRDDTPHIVRLVTGKRGRVRMKTDLVIRFDYGLVVPWVQQIKQGISALAGPDMLRLHTPIKLRGQDFKTVAEFTVEKDRSVPFALTWYASNLKEPPVLKVAQAVQNTEDGWRDWVGRCTYKGKWRDAVLRSLITLKALTFAPTGGIVAAPTTSLPEALGGVRNWDYRFCWVRDSTLTLHALMDAGYVEEAKGWRKWLMRAIAGHPAELNIVYGLRGERRLTELELPWLQGYENSKPVRTGNAAYSQFQLDIFGEVVDTMFQYRTKSRDTAPAARPGLAQTLVEFLETAWTRPDDGIWEVRGPRRHFTHSKMMAWVAMDRMVKSVEQKWFPGDVIKWKKLRDDIHRQVCARGFDAQLNSFVQFYGSKHLDASLLMMPLVGFLPADDPRVVGTVTAIEKHLMADGFVGRYSTDPAVDGLPHGEATFLPCTFWLADNYILQGRRDDAIRLFEQLLAIRNDLGLLAEEYDPATKRLLGNFPQAFSHVGQVNTAINFGLKFRKK